MTYKSNGQEDLATLLWLASASPRRQELLRQIGVRFQTIMHDVDEVPFDKETPSDFVLRMAREKSLGAWQILRQTQVSDITTKQADFVLGADTIVLCDGEVLGKPKDQQDGIRMLTLLSGREHRVLTAVAISSTQGTHDVVSETVVAFRKLAPVQIERYWQTGEPSGKAGAYAIQGFGGVFVKKISGSYSGVVGLPLFETARLLEQAGIPCWQRNDEATDRLR